MIRAVITRTQPRAMSLENSIRLRINELELCNHLDFSHFLQRRKWLKSSTTILLQSPSASQARFLLGRHLYPK
jgi:hypothetical protein